MITTQQLKIFEVFAKKPFAEYTRREIKKLANEKSNNALALTVNRLLKENVLLEKKVGKSGLLHVNMDNDLTFYYIALCNKSRIPHLVEHAIESIKNELIDYTPFYSLIIFGSYAANEQKKESDLDVAIFYENEQHINNIRACLHSAKLKSILELDAHCFTRVEMLQMLQDKQENLGKQIVRKHLAVYNHRIFYEIVKEGMRHGFRL